MNFPLKKIMSRTTARKISIKTYPPKFPLEKILDHRIHRDGRLEYLIKWYGYDDSENSWVFYNQLPECAQALYTFNGTDNGIAHPKDSWEELEQFSWCLKKWSALTLPICLCSTLCHTFRYMI